MARAVRRRLRPVLPFPVSPMNPYKDVAALIGLALRSLKQAHDKAREIDTPFAEDLAGAVVAVGSYEAVWNKTHAKQLSSHANLRIPEPKNGRD